MKLWEENKYRFITEDGVFTMTEPEYVASDIRHLFYDKDRHNLYLGRTLVSYAQKYLAQRKDVAQSFAELQHAQEECPIQFFAPSGEQARLFINDRHSVICFLTSGNRNGKSATMIVKRLLMVLPCDKDWPVFTEHGVEHCKWQRKVISGLASYEWNNHKKTLVPEIIKWAPKSELMGLGTEQKTINYRDNPSIEFACGSEIHLYAYNQDQAAFESEALVGWDWDEQPPEEKWDGANERIRTWRMRGAQHNHALTPHPLPGRPDTGGGSFLRTIFNGEDLRGYTPNDVSRYAISVEDPPDWIKSQEAKDESFRQWIEEPKKKNNRKRLREGKARHYGLWHESAGLIYEGFDSAIHIVDPFPIPESAARFRAVDHGRTNPCGGLWGAVPSPGSTMQIGEKTFQWPEEPLLILYGEYYSPGTVEDHCKAIIEKSGNTRIPTGETRRGLTVWKEVFRGERYIASVGDARSLGKPQEDTNLTLRHVYANSGLRLTPGSAILPVRAIPIVEQWWEINEEKDHPIYGTKGCPRILVFSTLHNFLKEIKGYIWEENLTRRAGALNFKETPRKKDDHLMSCLQLMIQIPPRWSRMYEPTRRERLDNDTKREDKAAHDRFTAY